eukprot:FR741545.1.p2 GENE.FR741545.1~~FR741545.1.p2  ORF type:complete len:234 (+),score=0.99 FR741545.1:66-767(+)
MAVPATVMYFTAYDELKHRPFPTFGDVWAAPVAGATARVFASTVTSPFELIRTLSQAEGMSRPGAGAIGLMRQIVTQSGYTGLWRGLEPTLWRDVPFSGLYWPCLEEGKVLLRERFPSEHPVAPTARAFLSGAFAGMLSAVTVTPFDVVKTRRQLYASLAAEPGLHSCIDHSPSAGNGSTPEVMRAIYREEGIRGLFSGATARVMKVTPACAIMIGVYETGKSFFGLDDSLRR